MEAWQQVAPIWPKLAFVADSSLMVTVIMNIVNHFKPLLI
jgi:hypothetical protein